MKFPKHRANVFLVERKLQGDPRNTVVGVFDNPEAADAFRGACEQDYLDRGFIKDEEFHFAVVISTFYVG